MLKFKKLNLSDIDTLLPYFSISKTRICDDTIGGTFMWRDYFSTEYSIYDNTMCLKMKYLSGEIAFSMPIGKDVDEMLKQIYTYCKLNNIKMIVCTVTNENLLIIKNIFNTEEIKERDWSDYLYSISDLALMNGKNYNSQRNHINGFIRNYNDYYFKPISKDNIDDVILFFKEYELHRQKDNPIYIEECNKVIEVLNNYTVYKMFGIALYVNNKIVAFSIGENIGDTTFVHIEKANIDIRGSYQMIVKEFATQNMKNGFKYINREEDVGDIGLRKSKISYHPFRMIDKYTVKIKNVK